MDYIISLVVEFLQDTTVQELIENNIKVNFIWDILTYLNETQEEMLRALNLTNSNMEANMNNTEVSEKEFKNFCIPDKTLRRDLLIRTS